MNEGFFSKLLVLRIVRILLIIEPLPKRSAPKILVLSRLRYSQPAVRHSVHISTIKAIPSRCGDRTFLLRNIANNVFISSDCYPSSA